MFGMPLCEMCSVEMWVGTSRRTIPVHRCGAQELRLIQLSSVSLRVDAALVSSGPCINAVSLHRSHRGVCRITLLTNNPFYCTSVHLLTHSLRRPFPRETFDCFPVLKLSNFLPDAIRSTFSSRTFCALARSYFFKRLAYTWTDRRPWRNRTKDTKDTEDVT